MRSHHVDRVLPYAPDQLFELVGDVLRYPEFVPWITSMRIWNEREVSEGVRTFDAEAAVGFSFLRERFSTRVTLDRSSSVPVIEVQLIRGPFRRLANRWEFHAVKQGTRIVFDIDFEFRSRLLEMTLAANFERAVNRLMACFEARAAALYSGRVTQAARPA